jgi:hypothetical protein
MGRGIEDSAQEGRNAVTVTNEQQQRASLDESFAALCAVERKELAAREYDGVSVALYWTRGTDALAVTVADAATGDYFELVVADNERPLDVYYHPFAYARSRGVELLGDRRGVEVAVDA